MIISATLITRHAKKQDNNELYLPCGANRSRIDDNNGIKIAQTTYQYLMAHVNFLLSKKDN